MGEALAETVIERHRRRLGKKQVKHITIDLDPTDDPTHGAQQLSFFNGHYDSWCYLPMAGFLTFNREPEQYLFTYVLRPGNAPGHARAQVNTLRERLLKLGAWIESSVRRLVLHLPTACLDRLAWCRIAQSLGAVPS